MITTSLVILYIIGVVLMYGRASAMLQNRGTKRQNLPTLWQLYFCIDVLGSFISLIIYTMFYFKHEKNLKYFSFK